MSFVRNCFFRIKIYRQNSSSFHQSIVQNFHGGIKVPYFLRGYCSLFVFKPNIDVALTTPRRRCRDPAFRVPKSRVLCRLLAASNCLFLEKSEFCSLLLCCSDFVLPAVILCRVFVVILLSLRGRLLPGRGDAVVVSDISFKCIKRTVWSEDVVCVCVSCGAVCVRKIYSWKVCELLRRIFSTREALMALTCLQHDLAYGWTVTRESAWVCGHLLATVPPHGHGHGGQDHGYSSFDSQR